MSRSSRFMAMAILLSVVLAPLSLLAKGTQEQGAGTKTTGAVTSGDPLAKYAPVEGKQYKVVWISNASGPTEENAELVLKWEKQFNIDLKILYFDKYEDQISLLFASGEIPDKIQVNPVTNFYKWIKQDLLAQIPEGLIQRICPNMYKEMMKLDPNYLDYGRVDGKIYGIRQYNATFAFRSALIWNLQWLNNLGIAAIPATLDDAEKVFYKFRREDPDKDGKVDTYAFSKEGLYGIFGSYGIFPGGDTFMNFDHWVERDGKLINSATAPEMKLALAKLAKWYKDGLIDPEWVTGENRGGYNKVSHYFLEGRIGMTNMGTYYHWQPAQYVGGYQGMNYTELYKIYGDKAKDILGFGPPLAVPGYKGALPNNDEIATPVSLGKPLEKEPDRMGKLLSMIEYFSYWDNYLTAFRGIEGKHWQMINGIATSIGKYVDVAEQARIGGHNTMIVFGTPEIQLGLLFPGQGEFAKKYNLDKDILKNQLKMPLDSQAKYAVELNKMRDEMVFQIVTGAKPVDYFDEYAAKYAAAGGNQLVTEANAWYDSIKRR